METRASANFCILKRYFILINIKLSLLFYKLIILSCISSELSSAAIDISLSKSSNFPTPIVVELKKIYINMISYIFLI